ncbi:MAG: TAXI family TRAP transporter solute-binding subunit [Betaproteobacteria bacterium]|nr:TAXI family TRAP transporter solute-binding subunit [Betaproteobacteria bacterium]
MKRCSISATLTAMCAALALLAAAPATAQKPMGIATLPQGSLGYAIASALAKVGSDEAGLPMRAVGLGGSSVYVPQINAGEIEFGTSNTFEAIFATQGTGNFAGRPHPHLRVVAALAPFQVGIMVRDDSGIRSLQDLKGKAFPVGYSSMKLVGIMQEAILEAVDIRPADLDGVPVPNFVKGAEMLAEGKVAGVLLAPGSGVVKKTNAQAPVRFLTIPNDPAVEARIRAKLPSTSLVMVKPNPRMASIREPVYLLGYQYTLITNDGVDEDVVYRLVKALYENKKELAAAHGSFNRFDPKAMAIDLPGATYHPGAVKFYRERGMMAK